MNIGDYIVKMVDRILDLFNLVRGYLDDALAFFEKIKKFIHEVLDYFKDQLDLEFDTDAVEPGSLLSEEHYFI